MYRTDSLRLEWSFSNPSYPSQPLLDVQPRWHPRNPAIDIRYEATLTTKETIFPFEIVQPSGWGWSELEIICDDLDSWRCIDGDLSSPKRHDVDPDETVAIANQEDSFSTVRGQRSARSGRSPLDPLSYTSASLRRQPLPAGMEHVEDFSFEMFSAQDRYARPPTPVHQSSTPNQSHSIEADRSTVVFVSPRQGRLFDLHFVPSQRQSKTLAISGTLLPLSPLTLVRASTPVEIPFIRSGDITGLAPRLQVSCPSSSLNSEYGDDGRCSSNQAIVGTFLWTNEHGQPFSPPQNVKLGGVTRVRVQRDTWGEFSESVLFNWPDQAEEVSFKLKMKKEPRISKAVGSGTDLQRCVARSEGGWEVILCGGRAGGSVEVVLDLGVEDKVPLPEFAEVEGKMIMEFRGDNWSSE